MNPNLCIMWQGGLGNSSLRPFFCLLNRCWHIKRQWYCVHLSSQHIFYVFCYAFQEDCSSHEKTFRMRMRRGIMCLGDSGHKKSYNTHEPVPLKCVSRLNDVAGPPKSIETARAGAAVRSLINNMRFAQRCLCVWIEGRCRITGAPHIWLVFLSPPQGR